MLDHVAQAFFAPTGRRRVIGPLISERWLAALAYEAGSQSIGRLFAQLG